MIGPGEWFFPFTVQAGSRNAAAAPVFPRVVTQIVCLPFAIRTVARRVPSLETTPPARPARCTACTRPRHVPEANQVRFGARLMVQLSKAGLGVAGEQG